MSLLLVTPIPELTEAIEEDSSSQRVSSLALVQSSMNAPTEVDVLQPIQDKEASLDTA